MDFCLNLQRPLITLKASFAMLIAFGIALWFNFQLRNLLSALLKLVFFNFHLQSNWKCDNCSTEFAHDLVNGKLAKIESEIEEVKSSQPEDFEKLLRKISCSLHENHYWILDIKRRLIDIYGNKEGFELYKIPKVSNKSKYAIKPSIFFVFAIFQEQSLNWFFFSIHSSFHRKHSKRKLNIVVIY